MSDTEIMNTTTPSMFPRGAYVVFTSGTVGSQRHRVVSVPDSATLTVRRLHGWRWVEWLRARWEDWVAWPIADWRRRRVA